MRSPKSRKQNVPTEFMEITGLGDVQTVYLGRRAGRWGCLVVTIVTTVAGCLVLVGGGTLMLLGTRGIGPITPDQTLRSYMFPLLVLAAVVVLIGLILALVTYNNWSRSAVIYMDGFALSSRSGVDTFRWENITRFTIKDVRRGARRVVHKYTFQDSTGKTTTLDNHYRQVQALATQIQEHIFPYLFQLAYDQYQAGSKVDFGAAKVSLASGFDLGNKNYAWKKLAALDVEEGKLRPVLTAEAEVPISAGTPVDKIVNLTVLVALVQNILEEQ